MYVNWGIFILAQFTAKGFLLAFTMLFFVSILEMIPECLLTSECFLASTAPCGTYDIVGFDFSTGKALLTILATNLSRVGFCHHVFMNLLCKMARELTFRALKHPVVSCDQ